MYVLLASKQLIPNLTPDSHNAVTPECKPRFTTLVRPLMAFRSNFFPTHNDQYILSLSASLIMNYDYGSAFSLKANLWPDRLFSAGKVPPPYFQPGVFSLWLMQREVGVIQRRFSPKRVFPGGTFGTQQQLAQARHLIGVDRTSDIVLTGITDTPPINAHLQ